jgi:hypothetical protein
MTFDTNTHIAPIVNVSTYDGPFSYDSLWEADEMSEREEGRIVCDDYDFSKMSKRIVDEANLVFRTSKPLEEYGVSRIQATKFGSPREYNFMTDWLDLEVTVVKRKFFRKAKRAIFDPANREAIVEYAGDHWVSRDGFWSMMLNRISNLSRDHWKHTHHGTHMATDPEVEAALLADMEEVFDHLEHGTGDDDLREFGAVLVLLWLIEYPSDFGHGVDHPCYGSWVTDEMIEHLQGNSSLSEFCTILEPDELKGKVGGSLIDFGAYRDQVKAECDRYLTSGVGDASQARAKSWLKTVLEDVEEFEGKQQRCVELYAPKWDKVKDELNELREEWDAKLKTGWPGAWK